MIEVGPFALSIIFDLLIGVIEEGTNYKLLEFFERRKIRNRIENATLEVDWFLASSEKIGDLLTVFIDKMKELVQQGHIERDAVYDRAIDFVRELQDRREALNVPA